MGGRLPGSTIDRVWGLGVLLSGVLVAAQVLAHGFPLLGADDANIFMTYGRNLATGAGWVYTPGFERVEGTTSFLFTLVHAVAATLPRPEWVVGAFNLGCLGASLAMAVRLTLRLGPGPPVGPGGRLVAVALSSYLAFHPGISFWCGLSLLDTSLWTCLVVAAVSGLPEAEFGPLPAWVTLNSFALSLTRPESLALVPGLLLIALSLARRSGAPWREAARRILPAASAFLAGAAGLLVFRLAYFGHPLPNTYYAKVGSDWVSNLGDGLSYVFAYLRLEPLSALALLGAVATLGWPGRAPRDRGSSARTAVCAAMLALWILPVFAGGDHFPQGRFLVAASLLAPVPSLAAAARRWPSVFAVPLSPLGWVLLPVAAGLAHFAVAGALEKAPHDAGRELAAAERGRRLGRALNHIFRRDAPPTVGAFVVGGLGYEYEGRTLDLLGLNSEEMAHADRVRRGPKNHAAFRKEVFYAQRPDLLPLGFVRHPADTVHTSFLRAVTQGLLEEEAFRTSWSEVVLARRDASRSLLELPDWFVPAWLQGRWPRSEGGPEAYRFLRAYLHRDLLSRVCGGSLPVQVIGPGCARTP